MMQECQKPISGIVNEAFSSEEHDATDSGTQNPSFELRERAVNVVKQPSENLHIHEDEGGGCGWLCLKPKCLQNFRTAKWVLFWLCWAAAVQGMVINGFVNVIISTIEKRYHLKSADTGLIAGCYDMGSVLCSIPVSYLGSLPGASKPLWVGWGLLIMGLGSFVFTLPHFSSPIYEISSSRNLDQTESVILCLQKTNNDSTVCQETTEEWLSNYQYVFMFAQFLHGVGASPLYILGITYLDESVPLKMSSFYLGIFHAMAVVGPAAGYVIGGRLLNEYIDVPSINPDSLDITRDSELWLGAWWIGFLISGTMAVSLSWIVMAFPAEIPGAKKRALERIGAVDHINVKAFARIRHLPQALKVLVKNFTFVFLSLAEASEGALLAGCATFMPKIIEKQYGFSAGFSALIVGVLAVPAGGGGTFMGGYIIKRFKMKCKDILKFCFIISTIVFFCCLGFLKQCDEPSFAGVNIGYSDRVNMPNEPSLYSTCNSDCFCDDKAAFDPICGVNKVVYFSPCHAGCVSSSLLSDKYKIFTDCACVESLPLSNGSEAHFFYSEESAQNMVLPSNSASRQKCRSNCPFFWWYLVLFFCVMFMTFLITMPSMSGTLRCVPDTHRSLALGVQSIQFRIFGTIPGPILFGALVMDKACYLWQPTCKGVGSCRHYDNSKMSVYLVLVCIFFKFISTLMYFLSWWLYKWKPKKPTEANHTNNILPEDKTAM